MFTNTKLNRFFEDISPEEKAFTKLYYDFVIRVYDLMDQRGWSQKDLAEALGKSPSEVNKWIKGGHNLTFKTIAKLEVAFGEALFEFPIHRQNKHQSLIKGEVKPNSDKGKTECKYIKMELSDNEPKTMFA